MNDRPAPHPAARHLRAPAAARVGVPLAVVPLAVVPLAVVPAPTWAGAR